MDEAVSAAKKLNFDDANASSGLAVTAQQEAQQQQPKRSRRIIRQPTKPLSPTKRLTLLEEPNNSDYYRNAGSAAKENNSLYAIDRTR